MSKASTRTSEPVIVTMSILAALQILFGGVGGVTYFADNELVAAICAVGMVAVGAAQVGVQFYVRGQVVPLDNVVEYTDRAGNVLAGPANNLVPEGDPVRAVNAPGFAVDHYNVDPGVPEGDHGAA